MNPETDTNLPARMGAAPFPTPARRGANVGWLGRYLLLLLTGCSTALSAIDDAEVELIRPGMQRAEVEKIVGKPDATRPLADGGEEVTYHVTLGIPDRAGLNWNSTQTTAAVGNAMGGANWGFLVFIPIAVSAGTFVVAEGINTGIEINRLGQGEKHDVIVTYTKSGEVVSHRIDPPFNPIPRKPPVSVQQPRSSGAQSAPRGWEQPASRDRDDEPSVDRDRLLREKWERAGG
ncbi:MAG: hypothetical protein ACYTGZ_16215 [Planctomycetota bacterium]|jgi:hypothetical protein